MQRIAWDQFFLAQSHLISSRSTCTRLMVGATIVRDKRIIAGGYNGSIAGGDHCSEEGCYVVEGHCIRTIHAEMNAILQCAKFGASTDHAEMYVTHFPCVACCKSIIQAGIKAVYYAKDYKNHPYAIELFERAGVEVKKVPFDEHVLSNTAQIERTVIQTVQEVLQQEGISQETITHLEDKLKEQFLK
ncbi:ComE operon protein 2 [Listeria booriae]|uniref:ComE operon protein 2 n=1 Tax=Listeria booriae TaxID=1552123 RepID=A0A7X1CBW2_9LIST|nr:ComE operon protein 2 [Listeria booriae]MBC1491675.1 ComE operon protein 2 [Listeria booriae]MBC1504838.1 ComE operon protein 2 [Listeria booriae]